MITQAQIDETLRKAGVVRHGKPMFYKDEPEDRVSGTLGEVSRAIFTLLEAERARKDQ